MVLLTLSLLAVGTAISPSEWAYVWIASSLTLLAMTKRGKGDTAGDKLPCFFCKRIEPVDASTRTVVLTLSLPAIGAAISPSGWAYVWIASSLKLLAMTNSCSQ